MATSGSITSAGVSLTYTPPTSNSQFFVSMGGNFTGGVFFLTQSINGGQQALVFDASGSPIVFTAPAGGIQFTMPYTDGQPTPAYQIVCKQIGSGTCNYVFSP